MNAALRTAARRLGLYKLSEVTRLSAPYCAIFKGQGLSDPNTNISNQVVEDLQNDQANDDYALINTWIMDDSISVDTLPSVLVNPDPIATIPAVYVQNAGGKVGINNISPTEQLHVTGNGKFSGGLVSNGLEVTSGGTFHHVTDGPVSIVVSHHSAQTDVLEMCSPAGVGQFSTSAAIGDGVIRTRDGTKLILQASGPGASQLTIDGGNSGRVTIHAATASTSNSTGGLLCAGGIGITNATDATSITNGGTLTTAGGAAIAKKLYAGSLTVGDSASYNSIEFAGVSLDGAGSTVIAERLYDKDGNTSADADISELLFTKFNDASGEFSPERIRHIAPEHWFSTYTSAQGPGTSVSFLDDTAIFIPRVKVIQTGEFQVLNNVEATSSSFGGALTITGGAAISKKLYVGTQLNVGTGLNYNFTQEYSITGNAGGQLVTQSKTAATASSHVLMTNDGDNTDNNFIEIFGLGTPGSLVNTEFLKIGFKEAGAEYVITTSQSGTGSVRNLILQSGNNPGQINLNTDGSTNFSSTHESTANNNGAFRLSGGIGISNTTDAANATNGGTFTTAGGAAIAKKLYVGTDLNVGGTLSKTTGTFNIEHPTKNDPNQRLIHSFIEGPRCDNIYRGSTQLNNGECIVNLDSDCVADPVSAMTLGTFESLNVNPTFYLQNSDSFSRLRGEIIGNLLYVYCEDTASTDKISWMVVAERNDEAVKVWDKTTSDGRLITEHSQV